VHPEEDEQLRIFLDPGQRVRVLRQDQDVGFDMAPRLRDVRISDACPHVGDDVQRVGDPGSGLVGFHRGAWHGIGQQKVGPPARLVKRRRPRGRPLAPGRRAR
jgi:hypothetical protein